MMPTTTDTRGLFGLLFGVLLMATAPTGAFGQQVMDDMEDDPASTWSTNGPVVLSLANDSSDVPGENGGSQSLAVTVDESEGNWGQFEGGPNNIDFSGASEAYLNFYLKVEGPDSLADDPAGLAVQAFDFEGEQWNSPSPNTEIAPSGWHLVSIPLSDFQDADDESGDGNFTDLGSLVLQFQSVTSGSEFTAKFDFIAVTSDGPLPVELTAFDAVLDGSNALVQWTTASETNNAGFDLMHEAPGTSAFQEVAFIEGAGTTENTQQYEYRMSDLSVGTHRFRLRQVNLDGSTTLSEPITVEVDPGAARLQLTGSNPFRTSTRLQYSVQEAGPVRIQLYDALGRQVRTIQETRVSGQTPQTITVDGSELSSGIYFLRLQASGVTKTKRLTIMK